MADINLSSDIYQLTDFVNQIKKKHIPNQTDETLAASTLGYLGAISSLELQNAIVMASEYAAEGIPIKAKFDKNVIAHAMSLGITKINATPPYMNVYLGVPVEDVEKDLRNDRFIIDKDIPIEIEQFEFHLDYDIIIIKTTLTTGEVAYSAQYDMTRENPASTITSPYLMPVGIFLYENLYPVLLIQTVIRQVENIKNHKKYLTDNPVENKTLNFSFDDQLVNFEVIVEEEGNTYYLTPIYDGLINQDPMGKYCYYTYMDSNSIRIMFAKESFEPRMNCDITISYQTTKGSDGNFTYTDDIMVDLKSKRISYSKSSYMIIKPLSKSLYGIDRKSVADLKKLIPKEALARNSITNTTDLENFFNSINSDTCHLFFRKKRDNQLERLYYAYIVLKDGDNVIPTNTIDIRTMRDSYDYETSEGCTLRPGHLIKYTNATKYGVMVDRDTESLTGDDDIFEYMNPFLCILNYKPFYLSYFLTFVNVTKYVEFTYINKNSHLQMICPFITQYRQMFTDPDIFKIRFDITQNIAKDFGIVAVNEDGVPTCDKLKIIGLIYEKYEKGKEMGVPIRYAVADFLGFENSAEIKFKYTFEFKLTTQDIMDKHDRMLIGNVYNTTSHELDPAYLPANFGLKIFMLADLGVNNTGDRGILDKYIPDLDNFTLVNEYTISGGIDLFYDYTDIVNTPIQVADDGFGEDVFTLKNVPVIRDSYISSEDRLMQFINEVEERRLYIEYCVQVLEDNFGVDFKFVNTYGPSRIFKVADKSNINRVNLTMTFRMKPVNSSDNVIVNNIIKFIKDYMEDINEITDLHMPNLITEITNQYREQLVYFEFIDINGYGPGFQHVYHEEDEDYFKYVPEFLNINTLADGSPDINIILV